MDEGPWSAPVSWLDEDEHIEEITRDDPEAEAEADFYDRASTGLFRPRHHSHDFPLLGGNPADGGDGGGMLAEPPQPQPHPDWITGPLTPYRHDEVETPWQPAIASGRGRAQRQRMQYHQTGHKCMFRTHETQVIARSWSRPLNRVLKGVLTHMQFPEHPNQHSCSPDQLPIEHGEQLAETPLTRAGNCPHTLETWEVRRCEWHATEFYVCEWHTYRNRQGGFTTMDLFPEKPTDHPSLCDACYQDVKTNGDGGDELCQCRDEYLELDEDRWVCVDCVDEKIRNDRMGSWLDEDRTRFQCARCANDACQPLPWMPMMHPILRRMAAKVDLHDGRGHQRWDWPMIWWCLLCQRPYEHIERCALGVGQCQCPWHSWWRSACFEDRTWFNTWQAGLGGQLGLPPYTPGRQRDSIYQRPGPQLGGNLGLVPMVVPG